MAHIANALLLLILIGGSIAAWDTLPDRIPVHMGLNGVPDRWEDRSFFSWFALPMIGIAIVALMYFLADLIIRKPHLINLPNKKEFLAMSPERQAPVMEMIRTWLYWMATWPGGMLLLVQYAMYRAAHGESSVAYGIIAMTLGVVIVPLFSAVFIARVQSRLNAIRKGEPANV